MNANERFEYMAEQFYKKTGMLAPGKDCPAVFARSEGDIAQRDKEWSAFIENFYANLFQTHADMYEMLELAMSLMDGDSIEDFTYQYKEIESLLKRARGE